MTWDKRKSIYLLLISMLILSGCKHHLTIPLPYHWSILGEPYTKAKWDAYGISIMSWNDTAESIQRADEMALEYCWRFGLNFRFESSKLLSTLDYPPQFIRRRYLCVGG